MARTRDPRHLLIKEVWPDKLLYGAIMVVISSAMGLLHALLVLLTGLPLAVGDRVQWLGAYPIGATVFLALAALVLALLAWRRLSVWLGVAASFCGIASLSLFGIGSLHAAAALVFFILARLEREDRVPPKDRVNKWQWPDKAFAASMLLLLAGTTSIAWGSLVLIGLMGFGGEHAGVWALAQLLAGLVAVVAAEFLYNQRAPAFGVVAGVLCIATFAGYVVAPGLALAAVVAIGFAWREHEFHGAHVEALASSRLDPPRT